MAHPGGHHLPAPGMCPASHKGMLRCSPPVAVATMANSTKIAQGIGSSLESVICVKTITDRGRASANFTYRVKPVATWMTSFSLVILVATMPAFASPDYLSRPDVRSFIDSMTEEHGIERADIERILREVRYTPAAVRLIGPAAELGSVTGSFVLPLSLQVSDARADFRRLALLVASCRRPCPRRSGVRRSVAGHPGNPRR